MAEKKRLTVDDVTAVWIAPETVRAREIQDAVDAGATAQEVADLAASPAQGEYREYHGEEEVDGRIEQKLGDRLQWVHLNEGEPGWYERHNGKDYVPVVTARDDEGEG